MTTLRSSNVVRNSEYRDGSVGKLPQLLGRVSLNSLVSGSVADTDKGNVDRRVVSKKTHTLKVFAVRARLSGAVECIFQKEENAKECCEHMNTLPGPDDFEVAMIETED